MQFFTIAALISSAAANNILGELENAIANMGPASGEISMDRTITHLIWT
jgi:carbamoylphosphate synthase large subunit